MYQTVCLNRETEAGVLLLALTLEITISSLENIVKLIQLELALHFLMLCNHLNTSAESSNVIATQGHSIVTILS